MSLMMYRINSLVMSCVIMPLAELFSCHDTKKPSPPTSHTGRILFLFSLINYSSFLEGFPQSDRNLRHSQHLQDHAQTHRAYKKTRSEELPPSRIRRSD
jgi:hypothetical protein